MDVHMWSRLRRGENPLGSPDSATQLCDLSPPSQPLWASVPIGFPHACCPVPGLHSACQAQSGLLGPSVLYYLTLALTLSCFEFLPHLDLGSLEFLFSNAQWHFHSCLSSLHTSQEHCSCPLGSGIHLQT